MKIASTAFTSISMHYFLAQQRKDSVCCLGKGVICDRIRQGQPKLTSPAMLGETLKCIMATANALTMFVCPQPI